MRIGELARRARVNLQTVRFYERRGLLRKPARTRAGYRIYEDADLESLVFIKWCQRLGFYAEGGAATDGAARCDCACAEREAGHKVTVCKFHHSHYTRKDCRH